MTITLEPAELISLHEAAAAGIERVRLPTWACEFDHFKISIIPGRDRKTKTLGPWVHLWAPFNQECNGRDPVTMLWVVPPFKIDPNEKCFEPYTGPLPDSDEYKAKVASFARLAK